MNEVNMKYWFSDFKKKIIDFLDELGLLSKKYRFLQKKNFRRSAILPLALPLCKEGIRV
jgi:hypothetical protein